MISGGWVSCVMRRERSRACRWATGGSGRCGAKSLDREMRTSDLLGNGWFVPGWHASNMTLAPRQGPHWGPTAAHIPPTEGNWLHPYATEDGEFVVMVGQLRVSLEVGCTLSSTSGHVIKTERCSLIGTEIQMRGHSDRVTLTGQLPSSSGIGGSAFLIDHRVDRSRNQMKPCPDYR